MSLDQTLKFLRRRLIVRACGRRDWPGRDKREANVLGKRLARLVGIVKGESTRVYIFRDDIRLSYCMNSTKTETTRALVLYLVLKLGSQKPDLLAATASIE